MSYLVIFDHGYGGYTTTEYATYDEMLEAAQKDTAFAAYKIEKEYYVSELRQEWEDTVDIIKEQALAKLTPKERKALGL